jgi:hypothetical protein
LAVNATVLRNIEQTTFYQLQQQPSPLFTPCGTSAEYSTGGSKAIQYTLPTGYAVSIGTVQYWNGTSFGASCTAGSNDPQLITLTVTNPNGSIATTQIAVDGIGVLPTIVSVTGVVPSSASTGSANLLLTITGTGFESGATVSFPSPSLITVQGTTTFVSPTTLTVFVDLYTGATSSPATNSPAGSYDISVTNPLQSAVSSVSPLFTVIALTPTGMHVSKMVSNIADPVADDPDENASIGWDAWDTITVVSGNGAPLQGVVINGAWTPAADIVGRAITTCTTDSTGTCTVYDGYADQLKPQTPTFTISTSTSTNPGVGGLVLNGNTYVPAINVLGNNGTAGSLTICAPGITPCP